MAEVLGISRIVVPPVAGLFSSFGLLCAEVEHHYSRTFRRLLRNADLAELNRIWDTMVSEAAAQLADEGFAGADTQMTRTASLHYHGQTFELTVPIPDGPIDASSIAAMEEAFGREHEQTYGHRAGPNEPVELVTILVTGRGLSRRARIPEKLAISRPEPTAPPPRQAYFGREVGWLCTPVIRRSELTDRPRQGPLIIEEYDSTCIVPPHAKAMRDNRANIIIDLGHAG
jgi:N-methylhydantoinase A